MQFTVKEVAALVGGDVEGDGEASLTAIGRIEDAGTGELAFLSNPTKYGQFAYDSGATALLVPSAWQPESGRSVSPALIRVPDVQTAVGALMRVYASALPRPLPGVDGRAYVHPEAVIDPAAHVGALAYVGRGARIGAGTVIEPLAFVGEGTVVGDDCLLQTGARLLHGCVLGDRVRMLANAVVGADGFGHTQEADGAWIRVPHLGNVVVGDDCEIGACATVDRAITGSTVLERGVKLDNLVMVAHNVSIGEHTAAAAQVGIAGSARIGARVQLGGQVGVAGHITLADEVLVAAQSGIKDSVEVSGAKLFGSPAKPFRDWAGEQAGLRRVGDLMRRLKAVERELADLKA